jgi:zinc transporter, ZIP family
MDSVQIGLLGLSAGVAGIGLGCLGAYLYQRPSRAFLSVALGFAAGIMLTIAFMELMAEALEIAGPIIPIAGLSMGMVLFFVLDISVPHHHSLLEEQGGRGKYLKKGILIFLGITLHNIPEGIAIGAGFVASSRLGWGLVILIALHNIPEGLAMGLPLRYGGLGIKKIMAAALIAGFPMGFGAWLGAAIGNVSTTVLALLLSLAAGAMIYIVCDELIPDAYESGNAHMAILGIFTGIVLGMFMTGVM